MGHDHGHGSATTAHRWRLQLAFVLVASFFAVELAAGLIAQSLALISDAGHMAADVVTLGAALVATRIATRPDNTGRRTFGSYRAEVFASRLAVLLMIAVGVYIAVESIGRIGQAPELASGVMLVVGIIGGVLGGWLFSLFGVFAVGTFGSIITSIVGAVVLLWIVAALSPKRTKSTN